MTKKYKIHEAAKDFNMPSKKLMETLGKYFAGEKKSQTALEEKELDVLFDVLTAENAVDSFDSYFAMQKTSAPQAKAEKQPKPTKKENAKPAQNGKNTPAQNTQGRQNPKKKEKDPNRPMQSRTKGEVRRVDTRAGTVDLDKYNERYENIAPANNQNNDNTVRKQKLNQRSKQYRKQGMRSRKRETEKERLARIAAERANWRRF